MTTPSSHSQQLLLLRLPVILVLILAAAAKAQLPIARPGCPELCGNISIPFPFGIGADCFRGGFEVLCNNSVFPPRAFLADDKIKGESSEPENDHEYQTSEYSWSPLELVNISVATGDARVYAPVAYRCSSSPNEPATFYRRQHMDFSRTPFAVSATRNVLVGVGWIVDARLSYTPHSSEKSLAVECDVKRSEYDTTPTGTNGSCTAGQSCCQTHFRPNTGPQKFLSFSVVETGTNELWEEYPCSYSMLAVAYNSGYNFSTTDIHGNKMLLQRYSQGVHLAIDFAAGDVWCPAEGQPQPPDYACVSGNSYCANATYTPGYICKCWDGYNGNPYLPKGCQDIDECKVPENPCPNGGICKNKPGGHHCPCKFGMKVDGKEGTCARVFTTAAKATVGAIGGILLMAVLLFLVILQKEKNKTKEFYEKNGGRTLEKANVIKLFKKGELKPILKNSNLIGKGCFGEVYKGLIHNTFVAIKKPINASVLESEQFANEVIIQSRIIHRNIVRLIGCCLEVDAPMLVYEYISQGSLHDILHDNNNKAALSLNTRLNIAAQSADGLAYMHSKANVTILHGDVKPANILLDDNFVPKIADFGISRLIARDKEHTGSIIGDMNYMDPVYLQEGLLTEKSDVYSFGVVILELISRRRAMHSDNNRMVKNFVEAHKKQKKATEYFDKEIAISKDLDILESLACMAVQCLSLDVDTRPTMMEVAERLLILTRSHKV